MKKSKKISKLILIIVIIFSLNMYSICYADNEKVTKDLELNACSTINNKLVYGCDIEIDGEEDEINLQELSINQTDFNLPSNLYDYREYIRMRVTYSEDDYKVIECKVIDYKTGEIIEDLSEENINKMFNIEYGKNINEKSWIDNIKLSQIEENEIYKYTANTATQFPKIENNTGKNCVIYIKQKDETAYDKKINMNNQIVSNTEISYNEYNSGDAFYIMYQTLEKAELLNLIEKEDIYYLSKYKDGDKLEDDLKHYIYNDTNQNITINTKNNVFGVEKTDSIVIEKGEICGFDPMIDTATINYLQNNNKVENKQITQETDNISLINNQTTQQSKENNSTTKTENDLINSSSKDSNLPKTGNSHTIIVMIVGAIIIMIIIAIKSGKYKNIK